MKTIGILGGMGPESTTYFNQRLISICQTKYKAIQDTDFPPMIIYDVPIREFDEKGIVNEKTVLSALKKGVKTLEKDKVNFIVIDCNTVHCYLNKLRGITSIPIVNIIEEIMNIVKKEKFKKIGILASETTIKKQIYDKIFNKEKIDIIYPTEQQKKETTSIILRVMGGKENEHDTTKLIQIIEKIKKRGARAIVIGCTELSIVSNRGKFKIPIIDSTDILAEATIKRAKTD